MHCIKTGFYAALPDGTYLYGDAFAIGEYEGAYADEPRYGEDHLLLRVTSRSDEKPPCVHISLTTWNRWFNKRDGKNVNSSEGTAIVWQPESTLVAGMGDWMWHGYKGAEL